jgi:TRAP-type C4-dicarboxylate transport system substrate-binding protein
LAIHPHSITGRTSKVPDEKMKTQNMHYGSIWPSDHVFSPLEVQLMADIANSTRLQTHVRRYTDEGAMIIDLQRGDLDIASTSAILYSVPESALMYLPFLYRDLAHFRRVWKLGANKVVRKIEKLIRDKTRFEPLGYSIVGVRDCILVDRPIHRLSDFNGLTMRIDGAVISEQCFTALGASCIKVPFYEVADALADRSVLAAENSLFNMIALKWYPACKYVSRTEHRFLLNFELASGTFWDALDSSAKTSIRNGFAFYLESFADRSSMARSSSLHSLTQEYKLDMNVISPTERPLFESTATAVIDNFAEAYQLHREIDWIREN